MFKVWSDKAWDDYLYWQTQDKKTLKKINNLIKECERTPFDGTGKPEELKYLSDNYWSRRIDGKNRLVYKVKDEQLLIASCRDHYRKR
ncbi:MAG: Txe/YoeB family addiction module toxin [Coriobacteriales bacterium]|jgi:toxin YoeB|nr:Txe/YoeB family addiction module toxin [Coriobacteriales bacterium]